MTDKPPVDREFTFTFTFQEGEYIIKKLGDCPYIEVETLIKKMKQQYEAQLNIVQEPTAMSETEAAQLDAGDMVRVGEGADEELEIAPAPAPGVDSE